MSKSGFRKLLPTGGGGTGPNAVTLFDLIKTYIIDAGFNVIINTSDQIEFMPGGANVSNDTNDDTPHYAIWRDTNLVIMACAVQGPSRLDPSSRVSDSLMVFNDAPSYYNYNSADGMSTFEDPDIPVRFAADGIEGWWWLTIHQPDYSTGPEALRVKTMVGGTKIGRLAGDTTQGLSSRYGVFDQWCYVYVPYTMDTDGGPTTLRSYYCWSPIGMMWARNTKRHTGSPLPRLAVPCYGTSDNGDSAVALGQVQAIMAVTDGWNLWDEVIPGWIMATDQTDNRVLMALPKPATFENLDAL